MKNIYVVYPTYYGFRGTTLENYKSRIQNARLIREFKLDEGFETFEDVEKWIRKFIPQVDEIRYMDSSDYQTAKRLNDSEDDEEGYHIIQTKELNKGYKLGLAKLTYKNQEPDYAIVIIDDKNNIEDITYYENMAEARRKFFIAYKVLNNFVSEYLDIEDTYYEEDELKDLIVSCGLDVNKIYKGAIYYSGLLFNVCLLAQGLEVYGSFGTLLSDNLAQYLY